MNAVVAQRTSALQRANAVRSAGAVAIAEVRSRSRRDGLLHAADLLEANDPRLGSVRTARFLRAIHRVGTDRTRTILAEAEIYGTGAERMVGALTERQRFALAAALRQRAGRR